jgi:GTPase
MKIKKG